MRQEIGHREVAFEAIALRSGRLEQDHRRRPERAKPLHELRALAHVDLDRHEVLSHELLHALVGVHLGIQPSARPSGGGRGEIQQNRFLVRFGLLQSLVHIGAPLDRHGALQSSYP